MRIATKSFSDQEIVELLRQGNEKAFQQVYYQGYRPVEMYITQNSGTVNDAKDLFQEALFVLVKKLRQPDFELTVKPSSYLSAIVKKMWLYKIRGNKGQSIVSIDSAEVTLELPDLEESSTDEEKYQLMEQMFSMIGEDCQRLLKAFYFEKKSLADIAIQMDYTTSFVRVKKYRCMSSFKKKIEENPAYKNL